MIKSTIQMNQFVDFRHFYTQAAPNFGFLRFCRIEQELQNPLIGSLQ